MEAVIQIEEARRSFGDTRAVDGLTLTVERGQVVGFLGLNGAGKTTTMRLLAGLLRADCGDVRVLGEDAWSMGPDQRRRIGYLTEKGFPYPDADLHWAVRFTASFFSDWDDAFLRSLTERLDIPIDRPYRTLSRGQQRKFQLALVLAPRPQLLLLDDPAQGLDVRVRREFIDSVVPLLVDERTTVLFSSHIMSDVERLADTIAVMHAGKLALHSSLDDLKENARRIVVSADTPPIEGVLRARTIGQEHCWTVLNTDTRAIDTLRARGQLVDVRPIGLEDLFIDLVAANEEKSNSREHAAH